MEKIARIYVADHEGFFGGAISAKLKKDGYKKIVLASRKELNLLDQRETEKFFKEAKPHYVFLSAQLSGGILANIEHPADFIYKNLAIQTNTIHAALLAGVKKLLFFGASCIYPKESPQPIKESDIFTGPFEKTSEAYSIAKVAGVGMCQAYNSQYEMSCIPVVPATVYGHGSSFDPKESHVLDALVRKFHDAKVKKEKQVVILGTGTPRREFIYIDDLANACLFLMNRYDNPELINIGVGEDIAIKDLAYLVKRVVGFEGNIVFDRTKPDGVKRKILDSGKIKKLGWSPKVGIHEGIKKTYEWFVKNAA